MFLLTQVDYIISILGLEKCSDVVIGTDLRRGISGGQAKRVNAGMELITNPSILFLDEPTSGMLVYLKHFEKSFLCTMRYRYMYT